MGHAKPVRNANYIQKMRKENRMSDDLISRKELLGTERLLMTDIVEHDAVARNILEQVLFDIENAPAAFNKERVIGELKSEIELYVTHPLYPGRYIKKNSAIEIVERGGIG